MRRRLAGCAKAGWGGSSGRRGSMRSARRSTCTSTSSPRRSLRGSPIVRVPRRSRNEPIRTPSHLRGAGWSGGDGADHREGPHRDYASRHRSPVADYNLPAAKKLAREMGPKARAIKVDVTQVGATAKALKGVFAVVNACRHDFNVGIMKAALTAKVHYCDLGGLFHETKKQLKLNAQFKQAG